MWRETMDAYDMERPILIAKTVIARASTLKFPPTSCPTPVPNSLRTNAG
jgi:hypothetical protein